MDSHFSPLATEESGVDVQYGPNEKRRIWKNVLALGVAFMIHFTAFWGASNLQSSINADEALGTFTLAAIYGSLILSNIFLPVIVIKWLGCKWTSSVSLIAYMPFILSQFYPRFYTMIPAGLAVGLGGGPLWCAKCTYLTVAADAYASITATASDVVVTRFFGVFFMFYQFSQVWGNLISSAVLSSGATSDSSAELLNATEDKIWCGANFDPSTIMETPSNPDLNAPSTHQIHVIAGIYLACMIAACLIVVFGVDSLSRYDKGRTSAGSKLSGLKLLATTMKQLANPYQILILPITMFIGAEQAFLAADFTSSFVACGWGISHIGYVMICFGVSNAISALCTGSIVKITGRVPVIVVALIVHLALMATLLRWQPSSGNPYVYFLVAAFWGLADAVWLVQINSMYGILFPGREEASYSNFRLWEATGSVITYAYSPYLTTRIKIWLLGSLLLIGFAGFASVEVLERRKKLDDIDNEKSKRMKIISVQAKGVNSGN